MQRWSEGGDCGMGWAGVAAAVGVRIWSMVDARASASRINHRGAVASLNIEPWFAGRVAAQGSQVLPGVRVRVELPTPSLR